MFTNNASIFNAIKIQYLFILHIGIKKFNEKLVDLD